MTLILYCNVCKKGYKSQYTNVMAIGDLFDCGTCEQERALISVKIDDEAMKGWGAPVNLYEELIAKHELNQYQAPTLGKFFIKEHGKPRKPVQTHKSKI